MNGILLAFVDKNFERFFHRWHETIITATATTTATSTTASTTTTKTPATTATAAKKLLSDPIKVEQKRTDVKNRN